MRKHDDEDLIFAAYSADRPSQPTWNASVFELPLRCSLHRVNAAPLHRINLPGDVLEEGAGGQLSRLAATRRWLHTIPPRTLVVVLDAWDVLVLGSPSELLRKFKARGVDVLISAELHFWPPDCEPRGAYPPAAQGAHFTFVNSGAYMGYAHALADAFDFMAGDDGAFACRDVCGGEHAEPDDMRCWHWYWKHTARTGRVDLDYNASVFLNMNGVSVEGGGMEVLQGATRVRYAPTGELPCMVHANGNGKEVPRSRIFAQLVGACFDSSPQLAVGLDKLRFIGGGT